MRTISRERFDALAGYARGPAAALLAREIGWFEAGEELVVGTVFVDSDDEYHAVVLARDLRERFRWIGGVGPYATAEETIRDLRAGLARAVRDIEKLRAQGDETGSPVDFFTPSVAASKLNRGFVTLSSHEGFAAARHLIEQMMRWHDDADGNFVEQLQTSGFDARLWELYLYAMLVEAGFAVQRPSPSPDFLAKGLTGEFAMEATTVNATRTGDGGVAESQRPGPDGDVDGYLRNYVPIKFAGPLTAKLKKRYWESPSAAGKPLVFAVQDFHDSMSMTYAGGPLAAYLYGRYNQLTAADDGVPAVASVPIAEHRWGTKTVPSGFFALSDAENVSAVIFNGTATLSKFNRIGTQIGFGSPEVVLVRHSQIYDHRPHASVPVNLAEVVSPGDRETWVEGTDVYHNPNAAIPFDPDLLPGAAHHHLRPDGTLESNIPRWHPMSTRTAIIAPAGDREPGLVAAETSAASNPHRSGSGR